jgi:AbrB family looped-hinge helix DNA binding protein
MRTKISSKGQIVLPAELRRQDRIHAGEQFDVERLDCGQYLLKKRSRRRQTGILDWLLARPERGWFRPLPSESTDAIEASRSSK